MNVLGKIFGSDKVIGKAVDGIYNGTDALIYTKEEKAERFERQLKLYEPFKLAQRLLALLFATPYVVAWSTIVVLMLTGNDVNHVLPLMDGSMGKAVGLIFGFYFAGGAIESLGNLLKTQNDKK